MFVSNRYFNYPAQYAEYRYCALPRYFFVLEKNLSALCANPSRNCLLSFPRSSVGMQIGVPECRIPAGAE